LYFFAISMTIINKSIIKKLPLTKSNMNVTIYQVLFI
jgi:hypothetical protein